MKINKIVVWISIVITVISIFLLVFLYKYPLAESIITSILTGSLLGIIVPLVSFIYLKKQAEIDFSLICKHLLNELKTIVNFYNSKLNNINYEQIYQISESIEKQKIQRERFVEYDNKVMGLFSLLLNYSDNFPDKLYNIIDDYCGFFVHVDKKKKQMQLLRDLFASLNYLNYDAERKFFVQMKNHFNGKLCKEGLDNFIKQTSLCNGKIELIITEINKYIDLTKISTYTYKAQGNK